MPITDTYGQGISLPVLTDAPNAQLLGSALSGLGAMVPQLVMRFASATARAATLTSPVEGMVAWLQDVNLLTVYDGTTWQVVQVGQVGWTDITPGTGFSTPQGSLQKAQYRVINVAGTARVELRGSFNCTPDAVGQPNVATLPVGARPTALRTLPVTRQFNAATSGVTRIEISTGGVISVFGAADEGATEWFCMDGQSFDI